MKRARKEVYKQYYIVLRMVKKKKEGARLKVNNIWQKFQEKP